MENIEKIKEYLEIDSNILQNIVADIHSYNGELDYLYYEPNEEGFYNTYYENNLEELARAIYFGNYKYTDEYIHINVYGNLETISTYKYIELLKDNIDEIIDNLISLKDELYIDDEELKEILESI